MTLQWSLYTLLLYRLFRYVPRQRTLPSVKNLSTFWLPSVSSRHSGSYFPEFYHLLPSVLWRCWLGGRKGIRPVKKRSGKVMAWLSVWNEVQTCIWPSWSHCHSLSLASVKSRLVLPFWYRPTQVVLEKKPLNVCVYASSTPRTPIAWTHGIHTDTSHTPRTSLCLAMYADKVALPAFSRGCCSSWSVSPEHWAHSSKPAALACGSRMAQIDKTNGQRDAQQLHRPCSASYAGSANKWGFWHSLYSTNLNSHNTVQ